MNWIDHLWIILAGIIMPILLMVQGRKFHQLDIEWTTATKKELYLSNSIFLFGLGIISIILWWINGYDWKVLGFCWPTTTYWKATSITSLVFISLYIIDTWREIGNQQRRKRTIAYWQEYIPFLPSDKKEYLSFIKVAFGAGIGEEILFRGYFLQYIKNFSNILPYAPVFIIGIPTIVFTVAHAYQGKKSVFKIFLFSLLFSLLAYFSQSLLLPIVLHIIVDLCSGYIAMHLLSRPNK